MPNNPITNQYSGPIPPIPEPLRGAEIGSFAHYSVVVRLPDIARRVLAENELPPEAEAEVAAMIAEISTGKVRPLEESEASDSLDWEQYVSPYIEQDWLEIPWFFAEAYFYRRILEATGYFKPGPGRGRDPFTAQKRLGLESSREAITALCTLTGELLSNPEDSLERLLKVCLWGNQADLSLWPVGREDRPDHREGDPQASHLLVDHAPVIAAPLTRPGGAVERTDFLLDNAGFELVGDLILADFLLTSGASSTVQFNVKAHPTFVSDAIGKDVLETVAFLASSPQPAVWAEGERLRDHLERGRLRLTDDPFWTSPLAGWEMPNALCQDLARSGLVISKGDANYRRLLGDRHWPFTTPFADILRYYPVPVAALRVLKSEVVAGLAPGQTEALDHKDPGWMVNGRWAVLQFHNPVS